jgi:hypothetical protein
MPREDPMTVKCPNCGASGRVPPRLESGTHNVRCRKCGVRFETEAAKVREPLIPVPPEIELDEEAPEAEPEGLSDTAGELGIKPEEEDAREVQLTYIPMDGGGYPDVGVSKAIQPPLASAPAVNRPSGPWPHGHEPEPWYYGFLQTWGALHLGAAGLIAIPFLISLTRVLASPDGVDSRTGSSPLTVITLAAMVVSSVTVAAVLYLIVDVARNIRETRFHAERTESLLRHDSGKRG